MKLNRANKIIFLWLPALVWAGIIFYLSYQPDLKAGLSTPNEIIVRKIAHVAEFGVLAWLVWRILRFGLEMEIKSAVAFSIIFAGLYAASDEFHQMFVMGRSGKLADVSVDVLGAILALQIIIPVYTRKLRAWMVASVAVVLIFLTFLVGRMVFEAKGAATVRKEEQDYQHKTVNRDEPDSGLYDHKAEEKIARENGEETKENTQNPVGAIMAERGSLPEKILIDVPFMSQAPFALWNDVHEEACEEASLIMIKYFLDGRKLSPEIAEEEIQKMKDYQLKQTGSYADSDMKELVEIAGGFYGLNNLEVVYDLSKTDLKKELAEGNPVIIPAAGRDLGNPFFTQPGPLYHNLVLIGYDGDIIIANDPGTKRGEKFEYDIDVLFDAIHDFPGSKEKIRAGRKAMIVVR